MERENVFYIKNMVCNRCILVVTRLLEKAGFTPLDVGLGTVVVQEKPGREQREAFRKLLEAADRADVVSSNLHDFLIRSAVHGIITDGTAEHHRFTDLLGFKESVDIHGHICLGQIFAVQTAAGHRVSHIRAELAVGCAGVHIGAARPIAERIDLSIGLQLSEFIRRSIAPAEDGPVTVPGLSLIHTRRYPPAHASRSRVARST